MLDGIAWAADKLGVPVVGGHLTIGHAPALSASCTGFARAPLRASAARPGDVLLAAFALDGRYMSETNAVLHGAARPRPGRGCSTDGEALVEVAEHGLCHAARDVVDARHRRLAAADDRGARAWARRSTSSALPQPAGAPLERWLLTFPSFGFLLAAPPEQAGGGDRGLHRPRPGLRAACGAFDATRTLRLAPAARQALAWDLAPRRSRG